MLLKLEVLEAIKRGDVTLQFRRWSRPTVKPGGTLKTRLGMLHIGRVDEMSPDDVTEADAKAAGFADVPAFRKWLDTMKQGTIFQRIEVSYPGDQP